MKEDGSKCHESKKNWRCEMNGEAKEVVVSSFLFLKFFGMHETPQKDVQKST